MRLGHYERADLDLAFLLAVLADDVEVDVAVGALDTENKRHDKGPARLAEREPCKRRDAARRTLWYLPRCFA